MSFYGNIINYFAKIKIGNNEFTASPSTPSIDITDAVKVEITENTTNTEDGMLSYNLKQGGTVVGTINIPLDLILDSSEITNINDLQESGTFLHLTFKTHEDTKKDVYINVTALNEIGGVQNDFTIVSVNDNQEITVDFTNTVKEKLSYVNTEQPIKEAIAQAKIEAIEQAHGVNFEYDSTNQKLKISYNNQGGNI